MEINQKWMSEPISQSYFRNSREICRARPYILELSSRNAADTKRTIYAPWTTVISLALTVCASVNDNIRSFTVAVIIVFGLNSSFILYACVESNIDADDAVIVAQVHIYANVPSPTSTRLCLRMV